MSRRARILALCALLAFGTAGSGCFVLDELDSGMAKMEEHSAKKKKNEQGKTAAEAEPAPGSRSSSGKADTRAALADWWKSARTPTSGPREGDEAADIVACRIGDETRFMSRTDCEVQGGRF